MGAKRIKERVKGGRRDLPRKEKALSAAELERELKTASKPEERNVGSLTSAREALFFPQHFFENTSPKIGSAQAFLHLLFVSIVPAAWVSASSAYLNGLSLGAVSTGLTVYLFIIATTAISATTTHLTAKLFSGKGKYLDTFKAKAFGGTPWFLLSFVPIASIFGLFWSVYLETIGLSISHKTGKFRAFVAAVLPLAIFIGMLAYAIVSNPEEFAKALLEASGEIA